MKALKIIIPLIVIILIIVGAYFLFFNKSNKTVETVETSNNEPIKLTAEEIINKLKEKGLNIGKIVVYTEETDTNDLLGRPNQYTSKASFEDTRLEQNYDNEYMEEELRNEPTGGTIEVFANKEDAQARKEYVESVTSSISFLAEYIYWNDYALLRLENELTPTQAKEYETAFNEIMENK